MILKFTQDIDRVGKEFQNIQESKCWSKYQKQQNEIPSRCSRYTCIRDYNNKRMHACVCKNFYIKNGFQTI